MMSSRFVNFNTKSLVFWTGVFTLILYEYHVRENMLVPTTYMTSYP